MLIPPANVSTLGITLATLSTFALLSKYTGEELNASKMFTALSILQLPMSSLQTLIASVPLMGATMASLQRIQAHLIRGGKSSSGEEFTALTRLSDMPGTDALERSWDEVKSEKQPPAFKIRDGAVGWTGSNTLLRNVSFEIRPSEICFIYGP
jgi:ABC-type multidrug transport system fused ATPase/permease subunit